MTNTNFSSENIRLPSGLWEASQYPGTTHAQIYQDSGLWHFGVANSPDGCVLVLDPIQNKNECIARTLAVADNYACWLISGSLDYLEVVIKHVQNMMGSVSPEEEFDVYIATAQKYYAFLQFTQLRQNQLQATAGSPTQTVYPNNLSDEAKTVWDRVLMSNAYLKQSADMKPLQKWGLASRLFLDACNRKSIAPFKTSKSISVDELSKRYGAQYKIASQLERQVLYNMQAEGLVEDLDRGVWKYHSVDYINNRYAIVLQTRWLSHTKKPSVLANHLKQEDFTVSPQGGWEHTVSPITKICVKIQKYPNVSIRMVMLFTKDILQGLGVTGRNRDEMLLAFEEEIAKDFARKRKFHKVRKHD